MDKVQQAISSQCVLRFIAGQGHAAVSNTVLYSGYLMTFVQLCIARGSVSIVKHAACVNVKVKVSLQQAMKAQKRNRGIAVLFL
jgi:hypothetical protein